MISMDRLRLMGCIHNMQILNYIINDEIYYKWLNRALMILTLSVGFFICGFIKKWEVRLIEYFISHPFLYRSSISICFISNKMDTTSAITEIYTIIFALIRSNNIKKKITRTNHLLTNFITKSHKTKTQINE